MDSISYISAQAISNSDLKDTIISLGGKWQDEPEYSQGVIEKGSVVLYVYSPHNPSLDYDDEELVELTIQLGKPPLSLIDINMGHGDGVEEFAFEIANIFIDKWGGRIDDNLP